MGASLRAVSENESSNSQKPEVRENVFYGLIFNICLPVFVLMRLSKDPTVDGAPFYALGPTWALIIGISIPLAYGIYDFNRRSKINWMSVLGFIVVLVKGLFGLFKLPPIWFACSEAALPLMFGVAILLNSRAKPPMVQKLLLNPEHIDMKRVEEELKERKSEDKFAGLMVHSSWLFAATMLVSAILNFGLAVFVLKADPHVDYQAYVSQIGKFTGLQYPVIALPLGIANIALLWWVLHRLKAITGFGFTQLLINAPDEET